MTEEEFKNVRDMALSVANCNFADTMAIYEEHAPPEERTPEEMAEGFFQAGVLTGMTALINKLEASGAKVKIQHINPTNN